MAKYKDTAELEYKGVDNLSNTIKKVNKNLETQQDRAKKTEDRIKKYTDRLNQNAKVSEKSAKSIKVYSDQLNKEKALHKSNIDLIADEMHKRDALNAELNEAKKTLNNLSKAERENEAVMKAAAAEVKRLDAAYLAQKKTVLNLKNDQTLLKQSINETQREYSKAQTAQERARASSEKMKQAINEQKEALDKHNRAIRESNVQILEAGGKTAKTAANFVKLGTIIESVTTETLKYGDQLHKADAEIDKIQASTQKYAKDNAKLDAQFDNLRKSIKKTQDTYTKYRSTIEKVQKTSTKVSNATAKVGATILKLTTPIKKVTSTLSKSKSKTDKQASSFDKLSRSSKKANTDLTKTNSLLGKIAKIQTIKLGISMASGVVNSVRMFLTAGNQLSSMLIQNDNITRQYNASLGDQTKVLDELYDSTLKYFGVSKKETEQTASRIAQQAENYNMTKEAAAEYAVIGTELASVLSVTNLKQLDMEQSSERLISALRGEAEAAELLGLNINATKMADYTEELKKRGAVIDGSFRSLDTATQADIRMMAAIEQTAVITGTAIDPIYDLASANEALNKVLLETGDNLTAEQKAAIKWKIAINEIKEAFRGFGVPLMNTMSLIVESVGKTLIKLKPLIEGILKVVQWLVEQAAEALSWLSDRIEEAVDKAMPYIQIFLDFMKNNIAPVIEGVKQIFNDLWTVVEEVAGAIASAFGEIGGDTTGPEMMAGALQRILDFTLEIISAVGKVTSKFANWVEQSGVLEKITAGIALILKNYIIPLANIISGIFSDIWGVIAEIFDIIANNTSGTNIIRTIIDGIWAAVVRVANASLWVWEVVGRLIGIFKKWLVESGGLKFIIRIFGAIAVIAQDVIEVLSQVFEIIVNLVQVVVERFITIIPVFLKLAQIVGMVLLPVIIALWKIFVVIVKVILSVVEVVVKLLTPITLLIKLGIQLTNVLLDGVIWCFNKLWDWGGKLYNMFYDKVIAPIKDLIKAFNDFVDTIQKKVITACRDLASAMINSIIGTIDNAIGKIQQLIGWFKDLIGMSEQSKSSIGGSISSASSAVKSKTDAFLNSQSRLINQAVDSTINASANLAVPAQAPQQARVYNSNRNNVTFKIAGGYRKSLSTLQREAQTVARMKGVPLR